MAATVSEAGRPSQSLSWPIFYFLQSHPQPRPLQGCSFTCLPSLGNSKRLYRESSFPPSCTPSQHLLLIQPLSFMSAPNTWKHSLPEPLTAHASRDSSRWITVFPAFHQDVSVPTFNTVIDFTHQRLQSLLQTNGPSNTFIPVFLDNYLTYCPLLNGIPPSTTPPAHCGLQL